MRSDVHENNLSPWARPVQRGRRRGRMSAAARRKLSRLMKQRWAQGKMKPRAKAR